MVKKSIDSPEVLRDTVGYFGSEVKKEASKLGGEFFSQLLGIPTNGESKTRINPKESATLPDKKNGFEIFNATKIIKSVDNTKLKDKLVAKPEKRAAPMEYMNYHKEIINSEKKASQKELGNMNNKIEQIQNELRRLIATSKELQIQFGEFTVQQTPNNTGTYYVNFLEWLLIVIQTARQKVENSQVWMNTVKGKHGKKTNYWEQYKQHGTSFGLSNERVVATQTG